MHRVKSEDFVPLSIWTLQNAALETKTRTPSRNLMAECVHVTRYSYGLYNLAAPCPISHLVGWQTLNDSRHLLICVYPEALLFGHARQLYVLGIQLLFHNLFQRLQNQRLSVRKGERLYGCQREVQDDFSTVASVSGLRPETDLVILVLQLRLRTLTPTSNCLCIVPVESTGRFGVVQTGAILIVPRNQQCDTKGPAHDALLAIGRLAEAQGQVADGLGAGLDAQGLVVVEGVALALDAGVLDHAPGIGLQAAHGATDVAVDFDNLLDGGGLEQRGGHALLDTQHHAFVGCNANRGRAELDGFKGVLDLEEAAFWGEGVDTPICRNQDQ